MVAIPRNAVSAHIASNDTRQTFDRVRGDLVKELPGFSKTFDVTEPMFRASGIGRGDLAPHAKYLAGGLVLRGFGEGLALLLYGYWSFCEVAESIRDLDVRLSWAHGFDGKRSAASGDCRDTRFVDVALSDPQNEPSVTVRVWL